MIFQCKWKNYAMLVRKSYFAISPEGEKTFVPGLIARFSGPKRIFDSDLVAEQLGWTPAEKKRVEEKIVRSKRFGNGIYLGPGQELSASLAKISNWKPPEKKLRCQYLESTGGDIIQCPEEPTAGREFCVDHDPQQVQVISGALTTQTG